MSKLYYWFILFTPLVNYAIIYKTETQFKLNFFLDMIYGAINGITIYFFSILFFIIFEAPYKKLIKLYFNISSVLDKVAEDEDLENETNKEFPLQDKFASELSEKDLENEIDNDETTKFTQ